MQSGKGCVQLDTSLNGSRKQLIKRILVHREPQDFSGVGEH